MINRLFLEQKDSYISNGPGKNFMEVCKKFIDFKHGKALDLGCGTGANLVYLQKKFDMYTEGCDINPDNFAEYNTKYDLNVIPCKIQEYPFKSLYDVIVCFNVFMWLTEEEQRDLTIQIGRHLTDRGVFIFSAMTNWHNGPRNVIADKEIEKLVAAPIVHKFDYKQDPKKFSMILIVLEKLMYVYMIK